MKKYYVKYKTLGMTLVAGCINSPSVDGIKNTATDLITRRHLRKLDDAWIEDANGKVYVLLNMNAYNRFRKMGEPRVFEWLTLH